MAGTACYGAVAAVPGIRNPVKAASLLAGETLEPLPCGLIRPT